VSDASFRFKLGKFACQVILDGHLPEQARGIPVTCLYVQTGKHNVMIDTGEGPGDNTTTGKLLENLKANGINIEDIDTVINTHAHIDHLGGNTDLKGNANFPNARYVIYKKEWDYWQGRIKLKPGEELKNETMHIPVVRRALTSIEDRYDLIKEDVDIVPGVRYVPVPGHTPGNTMVVLTSEKKQLFIVGDLLHETAEFNQPDLWAYWDTSPEEATRTRAEVVSRAVATKALVFIGHFPFPGLGYIVKKNGTFEWQPYINSATALITRPTLFRGTRRQTVINLWPCCRLI
jgi:glyoxylase-like metal-dependent hydrolase (beta-lactamase superfamily II)